MSQRRSILVVDDELLIRDLLYDFFKDHGWDISIAENGEKAMEVMRAKNVDLVLSDVKMPQMDGLDLSRKLRESYPKVPVVLMTGYPSVDSVIDALRNKVVDYIVKPFNINQLYKTVESQLEKKEA